MPGYLCSSVLPGSNEEAVITCKKSAHTSVPRKLDCYYRNATENVNIGHVLIE